MLLTYAHSFVASLPIHIPWVRKMLLTYVHPFASPRSTPPVRIWLLSPLRHPPTPSHHAPKSPATTWERRLFLPGDLFFPGLVLRELFFHGPASASSTPASVSSSSPRTHDFFLGEVLHAGSGNKNALKALIATEYSGAKVELVKNFQMGVSNKTPKFLKMNPIGKLRS